MSSEVMKTRWCLWSLGQTFGNKRHSWLSRTLTMQLLICNRLTPIKRRHETTWRRITEQEIKADGLTLHRLYGKQKIRGGEGLSSMFLWEYKLVSKLSHKAFLNEVTDESRHIFQNQFVFLHMTNHPHKNRFEEKRLFWMIYLWKVSGSHFFCILCSVSVTCWPGRSVQRFIFENICLPQEKNEVDAWVDWSGPYSQEKLYSRVIISSFINMIWSPITLRRALLLAPWRHVGRLKPLWKMFFLSLTDFIWSTSTHTHAHTDTNNCICKTTQTPLITLFFLNLTWFVVICCKCFIWMLSNHSGQDW